MGCAGNDLYHWSWSAAELQNEIFTDLQIPVCDEGDDWTNAREFDTLKSKNVPQSLEIGLFFVKFLFLIYSNV